MIGPDQIAISDSTIHIFQNPETIVGESLYAQITKKDI